MRCTIIRKSNFQVLLDAYSNTQNKIFNRTPYYIYSYSIRKLDHEVWIIEVYTLGEIDLTYDDINLTRPILMSTTPCPTYKKMSH